MPWSITGNIKGPTGATGATGPAGPAPVDATTSVKGIVQLAGDLGGTSTLPTVPKLGDLTTLATTNKANLVAAINEVKNNAGLWVSDTTSFGVPGSGSIRFTSPSSEAIGRAAFDDSTGETRFLQPDFTDAQIGLWQAGAATAIGPAMLGLPGAVTVGTATTRTPTATNKMTRSPRLGYVSATTAGALASIRWPSPMFTIGSGVASDGSGFKARFLFSVSDAATVAGARMFAGVMSQTTAATNVEPSTITKCIGVSQLSTDATQWVISYGGTTAQTVIPCGTAIGAPTSTSALWQFTIWAPSGGASKVFCQMTNITTGASTGLITLSGTAGTQLPATTQFLTPHVWRTNNATASAVAFDISSYQQEIGF